ncbi:hypothetical protein GCM10028805_08910 [Spirosoma harenae]
MTKREGDQLTNRQKWELATTVFAIYWPVRLYVHINHFSLAILQRIWPYWVVEIIVTILFFGLWLTMMDWIQQRISGQMQKEFLIEFGLPAQLATLVVAGALAIVFNMAFYRLWIFMAETERARYTQSVPIKAPTTSTPRQSAERGERRKIDDGLTIMAMLSAFYMGANRKGYKRLELVKVRAEQLKQEATQAQFMALKNQVNPHFLFNSLSILSSLIEANPKRSILFVSQLAKAYRYVLEQRDFDSINLQEELGFMNAYTFLLQIRFGDKLTVITKVPSTVATQYRIAPLTLQLLIENAVKHNQMSSEEPLIVLIGTDEDFLVVSNPIRLRPEPGSSARLGLKNITDRYRLLTDRPVSITDQDGLFTVKIPLLL